MILFDLMFSHPDLFIHLFKYSLIRCSVQQFIIKSKIVHFRHFDFFIRMGGGISRLIGYRLFPTKIDPYNFRIQYWSTSST